VTYVNGKTDRSDTSDNEYVPNEHADHEECDHVSKHETDTDGDNLTASDDSDTFSETEGVMKQIVDRFGINYPSCEFCL
jgi:hypothetical protein